MYADDASRLPLSYSYEPEDTPDGSTLAERLATDPEAFSDLYRLYLERVYRYLRARSSTEEEAADLTHRSSLRRLTPFRATATEVCRLPHGCFASRGT